MNEETPSPIFDSMLEEMLESRGPRDARASVRARLKSVSGDQPAYWNQALDAAQHDLEEFKQHQAEAFVHASGRTQEFNSAAHGGLNARIRQAAEGIQSNYSAMSAGQPSAKGTRRLTSWLAMSAVSTAAAILIALGVINSQGSRESSVPIPAMASNDSLTQTEATNDSVVQTEPSALETAAAIESQPNSALASASPASAKRQVESLEMDKVPFLKNDASLVQSTPPGGESDVEVLPSSDMEIVSLIDEQFADLWARKNWAAPASIATLDWMERVTSVLVGRSPTESEYQSVAKLNTTQERLAWLQQLSSSDEFAKHWSRKVAARWTGRQESSPERLAFEEWIAEGIKSGTPIAELQNQLLAANGSDDPDSPEFDPKSHWIISLGRGEAHQLTDRFGSLMLGEQLACARCHDDKKSNIAMSTYWGVLALLKRFELDRVENGDYRYSVVHPKKPNDVFFERADGSQAMAVPALPNGRAIVQSDPSGELSQLANWFRNSRARTGQLVNVIWDEAFGQSLVPTHGLSSSEGQLERSHLREFLAQQFSAHKEDLRKVLVWVAASKPFTVPDKSLIEEASGNDSIQSQQDRMNLFASFRVDRKLPSESIDTRTRMLAEWMNSQTKILGQPVPAGSKSNVESLSAVDREYRLVMNSALPDEIEASIDGWLAKKLSWDLLVEHAMIACDGNEDLEKAKAIGKEVLKQSPTPKQALVRLIKTCCVELQ